MGFLKITDSLGNAGALPVTTNPLQKKENFIMKFFKKLTKQNGTGNYKRNSNLMQATSLKQERKFEVENHQYFLQTGYSNFYKYSLSTDNIDEYTNWKTWMAHQQDWDPDLNILAYWNWNEEGQLILNFIQPRKGYVLLVLINNINDADLNQVETYLQSKLQYLQKLWQPIMTKSAI